MLGPPFVRFYAGAPLIDSSGFRLGSLCVLDHAPREFDAENCNVLCNFAEVVVREIEKDKRRVRAAISIAILSAPQLHAEQWLLAATASIKTFCATHSCDALHWKCAHESCVDADSASSVQCCTFSRATGHCLLAQLVFTASV